MPWKEATAMSLRREFVTLALQPESAMSEVCRRFGVSRKTGYKWLGRFQEAGVEGLKNRSRRPHSSPLKTDDKVEQAVLKVRDTHPAWGGRKIRRRLFDLGHIDVPVASTITEILRRSDRLNPEEVEKHTPWQRFEHQSANQLWQMDFKGDFAIDVGRCHPLTVLDDYSRYALLVQACPNQRGEMVQGHLCRAFERYGLPWQMLMDNGPPWSNGVRNSYTPLTVWMIRLGVSVWHSRFFHPQTLGKDERFHRTLKIELVGTRHFANIADCQRHFDQWREVYNHERPHEAIGMAAPATRYTVSPRVYPSSLPPIEYGSQDFVRKVQQEGIISFKGREWPIGKAFHGYPVGVRPSLVDGIFDIYFCHQKITSINLHAPLDQA